jgi:Predicted membrane protein (DUF2207) N-terminal domain/Predicted membrane protein (DUF2207) C-terminal domain
VTVRATRRAFLLLCLAAGAARADERILAYDAEIQIAAHGALEITETLRVRAEGHEIRRGIYRDFPTLYRDPYGNRVGVPFEVVAVLRDGKAEPWHGESIRGGRRIYLGAADVFLTPGVYTYTLTYRTDRQLGYFPEHDELYWNVTGNFWAFPIDRATAEVHLPSPVPEGDLHLAAYTGPEGARGTAWRASAPQPGVARFETTDPLAPGEGLTVVVGFPKGVVAEPTAAARRLNYARDNLGVLAGLGGLLAVLLWYALAWNRVGRDPAPGAIYPRYAAPEGFSPGDLRYIWRMGYDQTTVAAAMVSLAVAGALKLEQHKKTWVAERAAGQPAFAAERALYAALFAGGDRLEFKQGQHARVGGAIKAYQSALSGRMEKRYFKLNRLWWAPGALISLVAAAGMVALVPTDQPPLGIFLGIFMLGWNAVTAVHAAAILRAWREVRGILTAVGAVLLTLVTLPFIVVGLGLIGVFGYLVGILPLAVLLALAAVNVVFYQLMKAPTLRGREMLDAIEGLRLYLGVAERQDLEARHGDEPPRTLEEFERLLPYAIALDAAKTWATRFEEAIRAAEVDGTVRSRSWYAASTSGGGSFSAAALGSSLAGGLASSISSSAHAPGSSSGGGGGGSSGGGGGGGGGGGW